MKHTLILAVAVAALLLPLVAQADVTVIESRFIGGSATMGHMMTWAQQKQKVKDIEEGEDDPEKNPSKQLKMERAKLAQLSKTMGREFVYKYYVADVIEKMRVEAPNGEVYIIRFDEKKNNSWLAKFSTKKGKTKAVKIHMNYFKSAKKVRSKTKFNFDGINGTPEKEILGTRSKEYNVSGGVGGVVWAGYLNSNRINPIKDFVEQARWLIGGFTGELMYAVINELGALPTLAKVSGLKGTTFGAGNATAGKMIVSYHTLDTGELDGSMWKIPEKYKVKKVAWPGKR